MHLVKVPHQCLLRLVNSWQPLVEKLGTLGVPAALNSLHRQSRGESEVTLLHDIWLLLGGLHNNWQMDFVYVYAVSVYVCVSVYAVYAVYVDAVDAAYAVYAVCVCMCMLCMCMLYAVYIYAVYAVYVYAVDCVYVYAVDCVYVYAKVWVAGSSCADICIPTAL